MYDIQFVCDEKRGAVTRTVRPMQAIPAEVLPVFKRLAKWNKQITGEQIKELYRTDKVHVLVDDVGIMWATVYADSVEGHFVFWDGILRGRENLVRGMAFIAMNIAEKDYLWVNVPCDKAMIMRFLFRCGFQVKSETDGICKLVIYSRRGNHG